MYDLDLALRICGSDVHVWVVKLEAPDHRMTELLSVLSTEEKKRAVEFKSHDLTTAYVLSRGILRTLLSRYLGVPPEDVRFCYARNGKPLLLSSEGSFHFNVSHSGDLALYAFAVGCELGIDVEQIVEIPDFGMIARRFFSCEEAAELQALEMPLRLRSFFACWTRKEAYIKATGEGLSAALENFRVTLQPNAPAALVHINGDVSEAKLWSMYNLRPAPGYVGALAFRGKQSVRISPTLTVEQVLKQNDSSFVERVLSYA